MVISWKNLQYTIMPVRSGGDDVELERQLRSRLQCTFSQGEDLLLPQNLDVVGQDGPQFDQDNKPGRYDQDQGKCQECSPELGRSQQSFPGAVSGISGETKHSREHAECDQSDREHRACAGAGGKYWPEDKTSEEKNNSPQEGDDPSSLPSIDSPHNLTAGEVGEEQGYESKHWVSLKTRKSSVILANVGLAADVVCFIFPTT